ncbi:hypothetical protein B0T20DRAFT_388214 [Sordaria brevicollis]|uniref:Uncharacterized protein n=1 Tax=Sordaria brevicollis TaxID=83679 RepID=A0AAE0UFV3_SORBR|nr:hypothetical protein B0T20DRAFT_388214 [Sordaria brevicollis]
MESLAVFCALMGRRCWILLERKVLSAGASVLILSTASAPDCSMTTGRRCARDAHAFSRPPADRARAKLKVKVKVRRGAFESHLLWLLNVCGWCPRGWTNTRLSRQLAVLSGSGYNAILHGYLHRGLVGQLNFDSPAVAEAGN